MEQYKSIIKHIDNMRDLGGIKTEDGKTIKENLLYRSGRFHKLTKKELDYFNNLHIDKIYDLRKENEALKEPDPVTNSEYENTPAFINLEIKNRDEIQEKEKKKKLKKMIEENPDSMIEKAKQNSIDQYRAIMFHNPAYTKVIDDLKKHKSIMFHCYSGKDRTGCLAFLIEMILGVSIETAINDYMLTDEYIKKIKRKSNMLVTLMPISKNMKKYLRVFIGTYRYLIDAAIDSIFQKYKTINDYLLYEYNLNDKDIEDIRNYYLCG